MSQLASLDTKDKLIQAIEKMRDLKKTTNDRAFLLLEESVKLNDNSKNLQATSNKYRSEKNTKSANILLKRRNLRTTRKRLLDKQMDEMVGLGMKIDNVLEKMERKLQNLNGTRKVNTGNLSIKKMLENENRRKRNFLNIMNGFNSQPAQNNLLNLGSLPAAGPAFQFPENGPTLEGNLLNLGSLPNARPANQFPENATRRTSVLGRYPRPAKNNTQRKPWHRRAFGVRRLFGEPKK